MKTLILASLVLLGGCATKKQYQLEDKTVLHPSHEGRKNYFLWALFQDTSISSEGICKEDESVIAIDLYSNFSDLIASYITLGAYSPKSYVIYCHKKTLTPSAQVTSSTY